VDKERGRLKEQRISKSLREKEDSKDILSSGGRSRMRNLKEEHDSHHQPPKKKNKKKKKTEGNYKMVDVKLGPWGKKKAERISQIGKRGSVKKYQRRA